MSICALMCTYRGWVSGGEERQNYAEQKNGDLQREVSLQRIVPFASRDTLSNSYYSGRYPKEPGVRTGQPTLEGILGFRRIRLLPSFQRLFDQHSPVGCLGF
jgi:hypothetical protein